MSDFTTATVPATVVAYADGTVETHYFPVTSSHLAMQAAKHGEPTITHANVPNPFPASSRKSRKA